MELIPWSGQRSSIFLDRYAKKDGSGEAIESHPEEMWTRVADKIGETKEERDLFYSILHDWKFVPSGRILSGGKTSYNCFVQGFQPGEQGADSRKSIMNAAADMVEITSRGGGVGINWSPLRPQGTYIRGVDGASSGSIAWMRGCDGLVNAIRQGGSRTAAMMFMLDIWHPDIIEFTRMGGRFQRANYSVNVSDEFMSAAREGKDWSLIFPNTAYAKYNVEWDGDIRKWIKYRRPIVCHGTVPAISLWQAICESAYMTGNPGLGFLDRCNEWSNVYYLHRLACFNPCGEQPLPIDGSCNLGSINLLAMLDDHLEIDYMRLRHTIQAAIRFLDRVIDLDESVTPGVQRIQEEVRRVGLGTMGLADVMILLGVKYGSQASVHFVESLYTFIRDEAYVASVQLASEKGYPYGFRDGTEFLSGKFIQTLPGGIQSDIRRYGIRNLSILTQAPTGTTSILAGASSGVEPIFSKSYTRKDATGCNLVEHPLADRPAMVTAQEISQEAHILIQATIQRYVDASISKTVNLPESSTVEDISKAFALAYDLGCKGITVYRATEGDGVLCESCNI